MPAEPSLQIRDGARFWREFGSAGFTFPPFPGQGIAFDSDSAQNDPNEMKNLEKSLDYEERGLKVQEK